MEIYTVLMSLVEGFGCSFDTAFFILLFFFVISLAFTGCAFGFFFDIGALVYDGMKSIFVTLFTKAKRKKP